MVAEFETSGLSRTEFCRNRGLSVHTFDRYRYGLRQAKKEAGGGWVAVEVCGPSQTAASGSGLAVALAGGRRIEVARGFDRPTLQQLLAALEQA